MPPAAASSQIPHHRLHVMLNIGMERLKLNARGLALGSPPSARMQFVPDRAHPLIAPLAGIVVAKALNDLIPEGRAKKFEE